MLVLLLKFGKELVALQLIGAIVTISAVELLKAFLVSTTLTGEQIGWKIAIGSAGEQELRAPNVTLRARHERGSRTLAEGRV